MPTKQQYKYSKRRKELGLAWCSTCKQDKPQADFEPSPGRRPFDLSSSCRECNNKRKLKSNKKRYWSMTKEERFEYNRGRNIRRFGIDTEKYEEMLGEQNFVCAICKKPESVIHHSTNKVQQLTIDHDHNTKIVRGLLCTNCNRGIGLLRHDENNLLSAVEYLRKHK